MQVHIDRNGERYGPYSIEDINAYLANGTLLPTDLAWQDGMTDWLPVSQISGVGDPGMPAGAPSPHTHDIVPQPAATVGKKKLLIGIGSGVGLLVLVVAVWFFFLRSDDGTSPMGKVAGVYHSSEVDPMKFELAEDGSFKRSYPGHSSDGTWRIENGEVILIDSTGEGVVLKIESNGNLTAIAMMEGGERKAWRAGEKFILTRGEARTETNTAAVPTALTAAERKVVGEYHLAAGGMILSKLVFEENRNFDKFNEKGLSTYEDEVYETEPPKWKIANNGELHVDDGGNMFTVYRINPDGSLQRVAYIDEGKREDDLSPGIYKKIK